MIKKGVLFVCYGNACRSIMAEALTKHYWGAKLLVSSAGIAPLGRVAESTFEVLKEAQIPCERLFSKGFSAVDFEFLQLIVNLTDSSLDGLIPRSFIGRTIDWYVRDPYGESLDSFRKARDAIEWLVTEKLPLWLGMRTE
jgi:arsenate reductase